MPAAAISSFNYIKTKQNSLNTSRMPNCTAKSIKYFETTRFNKIVVTLNMVRLQKITKRR